MTELEKMQRAKMYIDKLANGTDPITDTEMPNDSTLNNVRLSRCFFYISDILRRVIENGGTVTHVSNSGKADFVLDEGLRVKISYSKEPVPISKFMESVNGMINLNIMKKLPVTAVTNWLTANGFLTEITANGRKSRIPTSQGTAIGLSTLARQGLYGEYSTVLYNEDAQRFIIDNIDSIIQCYRERSY